MVDYAEKTTTQNRTLSSNLQAVFTYYDLLKLNNSRVDFVNKNIKSKLQEVQFSFNSIIFLQKYVFEYKSMITFNNQ